MSDACRRAGLRQLRQLAVDLLLPVAPLLVRIHRERRKALVRHVVLPLLGVVDLLEQVLIVGRGLVRHARRADDGPIMNGGPLSYLFDDQGRMAGLFFGLILGAVVAPHQGALAPSIFVLIHMLWAIGLVFNLTVGIDMLDDLDLDMR